MSSKIRFAVCMIDNFADKTVKAFINTIIDNILSKIESKSQLSSMQKFFCIVVTLRNDFSKFISKENAINLANSLLINDLQSFTASDLRRSVSTDLNFSNQLFNTYADSNKFEFSKDSQKIENFQEIFDKFTEAQKTRKLSSLLNIMQVNVRLDINVKKDLQNFRVCKSFISFCDRDDRIKLIEAYSLNK